MCSCLFESVQMQVWKSSSGFKPQIKSITAVRNDGWSSCSQGQWGERKHLIPETPHSWRKRVLTKPVIPFIHAQGPWLCFCLLPWSSASGSRPQPSKMYLYPPPVDYTTHPSYLTLNHIFNVHFCNWWHFEGVFSGRRGDMCWTIRPPHSQTRSSSCWCVCKPSWLSELLQVFYICRHCVCATVCTLRLTRNTSLQLSLLLCLVSRPAVCCNYGGFHSTCSQENLMSDPFIRPEVCARLFNLHNTAPRVCCVSFVCFAIRACTTLSVYEYPGRAPVSAVTCGQSDRING